MNHPWGLSGPAFLWLYGIALVVLVIVAVSLRMLVRRPRLAGPAPAVDPIMVAYLTGYWERVVETALARLVEQGAVRVTRAGMVTRTTKIVDDPVDQAVLDQLGGRARPVYELIRLAVVVPPVTDVAGLVEARQLQVSHRTLRRARSRGLVPIYVLLAVGVARLITGMAGGYPVGYLVLELLVTIVVILVLHRAGAWRFTLDTVHGDRMLAAAAASDDAASLVARHGLRYYPDEEIANAMDSTRYEGYAPSRSEFRPRSRAAGAAGAAGIYASCGGSGASCGGGSSGGSSGCGGGCGGGGA